MTMNKPDDTACFLPDPKQKWAHSTCSREELLAALYDRDITAIEADIVMGRLLLDDSGVVQPIMAHPPNVTSDLTFDCFMELAAKEKRDGIPYKHLKLDFKQLETLEPALNSLHTVMSRQDNAYDKTIFLNADILHGPGKRSSPLHIDADTFIDTCLRFTRKQGSTNDLVKYSLSLGWSVDCRSFTGYTSSDVDHMMKVIERNGVLTHFSGMIYRNICRSTVCWQIVVCAIDVAMLHLHFLLCTKEGLPIEFTFISRHPNHDYLV
jgi:Uncharacterized conserved protein (DUF2181).